VGQERLAHGRATSGKVLFEIPAKGTRRSKSLEVLIPILYLKGMSTGDFEEALAAPAAFRPQPSRGSRTLADTKTGLLLTRALRTPDALTARTP